MDNLSTFSQQYNRFIGGFRKGIITGIYGPAASGKTLTCILAMLSPELKDKKIIYIDTEKGFSVDRINQISDKGNEVLKNTIFFHNRTFAELKKTCQNLADLISDKFGLIIVDTVSYPYRIEIAKKSEMKNLNVEFNQLVGHLSEMSKTVNMPVIVTSQVYADLDNKDKVNPIGGMIFRNRCRCLIELQKLNKNNRRALLLKHPDLPENEMKFKIVNKGIINLE